MVTLGQLQKSIDAIGFAGEMDLQVKGLKCDSRMVCPGDLFVAIKGYATDGHLYLNEVAGKGAVCLVIEDRNLWEQRALSPLSAVKSVILVRDARQALALMSDKFYAHPSRSLKVIGVTGTNGKTTTCYLISKILETAREKTGWVTTLDYGTGEGTFPSERTTPDALHLTQMLSMMRESGCGWAVVEVSSHSLALERVTGCWFSGVVITNITADHLDFHKTRAEYIQSKARLFDMVEGVPLSPATDRLAVLNRDDPYTERVMRGRIKKVPVLTYGIERGGDITAERIYESDEGMAMEIKTLWGDMTIESPMIGRPNVYNILAASALSLGFGIGEEDIAKGVSAMRGVPGRYQRIMLGQPFEVIIDYAHTDDALAKLISMARSRTKGRVVCVFGCGGDRDRSKRPRMGMVAAKGCDLTILTSDNPRGEDPSSIIRQIEEGFLKEGSAGGHEVIVDRREAIYKAIGNAGPGDVVVVAGKGHEKKQIIGSKTLHFDDREVAEEAINHYMIGNGFGGKENGHNTWKCSQNN